MGNKKPHHHDGDTRDGGATQRNQLPDEGEMTIPVCGLVSKRNASPSGSKKPLSAHNYPEVCA